MFSDTNVLVQARFASAPMHGAGRRALDRAGEKRPALSRQVLREYLAIVTQPRTTLLLPRPSSATTLGDLEAWCAPEDKGGRPALCGTYLDTGLELLASPDPVTNGGMRTCVPAQENRAHVVDLLRDYVRQHPDAHDMDLVAALGQALQRHFPCRGK